MNSTVARRWRVKQDVPETADARIDALADVLGGLFGEDALGLFPDVEEKCGGEGGKPGPCPKPGGGDDSKKPPSRQQQRQEARDGARKEISRLKGEKPTPENTKELMQHLSTLSVKDLHDLKRENGLKASGRLKSELVAKLSERLRGSGTTGEKPAAEEPARRAGPRLKPGEVRSASTNPSDINLPEELKKPPPDITKQERGALNDYTNEGYRAINKGSKSLREGGPMPADLKENAENISKLIERTPKLAEPITTWRGIKLDPEAMESFLDQIDEAHYSGDPISLKGFTSSTMDPNVATKDFGGGGSGGVMFEITANHGVYLPSIPNATAIEDEREFLMNHGAKFRVVGVSKEPFKNHKGEVNHHRVVQLEQVA